MTHSTARHNTALQITQVPQGGCKVLCTQRMLVSKSQQSIRNLRLHTPRATIPLLSQRPYLSRFPAAPAGACRH